VSHAQIELSANRSEFIKISVPKRCSNSSVSTCKGTSKILYSKLERNYTRSLDLTVNQRDIISLIAKPLSREDSNSFEIRNFDRFRNRQHAVREATPTSDSFYSNIFLVPQKGGKLRPVKI
jgi:hypothetical protein